MQRIVGGLIAIVVIGLMWVTLGRLIFIADVGQHGMLSSEAVVTYLLLFLAPAATFIPLRLWTNIPLFDVEGIAGWATLGFALAFLRPGTPPTLGQFLFFILTLTVALSTICTLLSFAVGLRACRDLAHKHDVMRARRQGYLLAMFIVACFVLHGIGTLTPASGTLLFMLLVLAEVLAFSRANAKPAAQRAAGSSAKLYSRAVTSDQGYASRR